MTDSDTRPDGRDATTPASDAEGHAAPVAPQADEAAASDEPLSERPLSTSYDEGSATLRVRGGVFGEAELERLQEAVQESTAGLTRTVTVDLSETDFFPSRAVGVLVLAMRKARANNATLELVATVGSLAHRVLSISGLPVVTRG